MSMASRIYELQRMSIGRLRSEYRTVFGEDTRSSNREHLVAKIAWRIQAEAEGGLSERARRRARELTNETEVRLRPPKGPREAGESSRATPNGSTSRDPRLPIPGTVLRRAFKGRLIEVRVLRDAFEYDGERYDTLTAVVDEATGSHWNPFRFFGLDQKKAS